MKFDYAYRDKENVRHDGTVVASSKDEAFKKLRAIGVKPFFVGRSPGVWNFVLSLGKRGLVIAVLAVIACSAICVSYSLTRTIERVEESSSSPLTRRQIYGDPALMEKLESGDYALVFVDPGDRVLAHFAQPAKLPRYVVNVRQNREAWVVAVKALETLAAKLKGDSGAADALRETREEQELQRIIAWMHEEFLTYLSNGNGTPSSYLRRLVERQVREAQIHSRAKVELAKEKDPKVWEKRNNELRSIGAPTIPMPSEGISNE